MYSLNPTIFLFKNTLYSLVRKETDVKNWNESILRYELNILHQKNINIKLKSFPCSFQVDSNKFKSINRKNMKYPYYGIEDIKFAFIKNNKIYGVSNVLIQQRPFRKFQVGIIEIDIEDKNLILKKLLEKPNMTNQEKNWTIYSYQNKNYIITNLLPKLEIYELTESYELKLIISKRSTYNYNFLTFRLHNNYKNLILTPCQSLYQIKPNIFLILLKKRLVGDFYEYYIGYFNPKNFELLININQWDRGYKKYLNSFQIINNYYYYCFGIQDMDYKINQLTFLLKNKTNLKQII